MVGLPLGVASLRPYTNGIHKKTKNPETEPFLSTEENSRGFVSLSAGAWIETERSLTF